jgi:hypothetical protein
MATNDSCFFEMDETDNISEEMAALVDAMIEAPVAITPPTNSPTLHRATARKELNVDDMFPKLREARQKTSRKRKAPAPTLSEEPDSSTETRDLAKVRKTAGLLR